MVSDQGAVLQEVKKNLQVILVTYKVEFYGPFLARDLLRPIFEQVIKDLTLNNQRVSIVATHDFTLRFRVAILPCVFVLIDATQQSSVSQPVILCGTLLQN